MPSDTIQVCYAIHDERGTYCKFLGTAIYSMLVNTSAPVTVHVLHDSTLSQENMERLAGMVRSHGKELRLYDVDALMGERLRRIEERLPSIQESRLSPAAIYRLLLGDLLDSAISRVIYLDADTIVNLDIAELWQEQTGPAGVAAVCEKHLTHGHNIPKHLCKIGRVSDERYFNSGVLLMELDALRSRPGLLGEGIDVLRRYPECDSMDQDILNWFFAGSYRELPLRYNVFPEAERIIGNGTVGECIYHYAGIAVNCLRPYDPYNLLYFRHFVQTPWFDERVFLMALESCANTTARTIQEDARQCFNLVSGRRRTLYGNNESESALRSIFALGSDEVYFPIASEADIPHVVEHMRNCPDMLHVFCSLGDYASFAKYLASQGFCPERNFINGDLLIPAEYGGDDLSQFFYNCGRRIFLGL